MRRRHGIVMVAHLAKGKAYYSTSNLHADTNALEIHIFDPAELAQVLGGQLAAFRVRPKEIFVLDDLQPFIKARSAIAATFDRVGNKLYVMQYWGKDDINYLHDYAVATGD